MKSICITGAIQSDLQTVADILQQAGMKQPGPARRDNDSVDIEFWHEQVMTLAAEDSCAVQPISNPGRLWEQLASDIFIANIESKVWGWSDTRSTWLLNYWLDFEPHLNFILICVSPQQMLASAMASVSDTTSIETIMSTWQAHHQELLRFHYRNPHRSLLVDFNECIHYPRDLIKRCAEQWKLPLATPGQTLCYEIVDDSLAIYLAHQMCQDYPQIVSLQHELAATITHLSETDQVIHTRALTPAQIIADYRALGDRSAELRQVQAANEELVALKTRLDDTMASHAQQQNDSEALFNEAAQKIELLLLQLHQAQEELETTFLKQESQQAQIDTLTEANVILKGDKETLVQEKSTLAAQREALRQEVVTLGQARDEQARILAERQTQLEQLNKTQTNLKEVTQENELLLLQLHQVQEELETTFSKHESQQAQIDTLTEANAVLKGDKETLVQEKSVLAAQREALQQEVAALGQAREEQARILAESQAQIEQLNKTQTNLKEVTQENELLLLQLHQVQEELETTFSKQESQQAKIDTLTEANSVLKDDKEILVQEKSALAAQRDALQQEVAALGQARDEQGKLAAERQAKIEALTQERDSQASHVTQRQAQIDTLIQGNAVLKGDKEALMQEKSVLATQRDALQQEVAALGQAREEQARILAECQAQIEQLNKNQANLKEVTQENELLLLQLHQVQEELEHHFLQHQDMEKQVQIAEARWQRVLQRNPTYLDYEAIEILPAPSAKNSVVAWRLTNFSTTGRHLPILEFKTSLEYGAAGLIFPRPTDGDSLLTRWPAAANQQNELILMPVGTKATHQQRAEILFDLATSDWSLLQPLTALLIKALTSSTILKEHTDFQPEAFRKGLEMFHQIIQKFPPTLRYDQVQLKREQVISGYEHLWLHFDNLSFDGKHWSEFEFRLACSNVQPDRFGFHPKLEFPEEGGQAPFEAWFSESRDDFGNKLELRFVQPDAMDMAIWRRLTEHDHLFLAALIKRLPAILGKLQSLNVQLKRPWADWIKMAREIQRIAALCTAAAVPPTPAPIALIQPAAPESSASPSKVPKHLLELSSTVMTSEKPLRKKPALKTKTAKPAIETREA